VNPSPFAWERRVPLVLQSEVAECGLAALAMVAGYHGRQIDLHQLRQRAGSSLKGMNLKELMRCAELLQLAPRALRLELADLPRLRRPAILHWQLDHFVVLVALERRGARIHDPARGLRRVTPAELSSAFSGVALELTPRPDFARGDDSVRLRLRQLWSASSGLSSSIAHIVLLAMAIQLIALALPYFLQIALDRILLTQDRALLIALAAGFAGLALFKAAIEVLRGWAVLYLGSTLSLQLGSNLLRHLLRLPLDFFRKRHVGDLQSRFAALDGVRRVLCGGLIEALVDGVMAVATLVLMLLYGPGLALIALLATLAYAVARLLLYRPQHDASTQALAQRARCESHFLETLRAMQPVKSFGREPERLHAWEALQSDSVNADARVVRRQLAQQAAQGTIAGLEYVALILAGVMAVLDQRLSVGMLMAFLAYRQQFSTSCQLLVNKLVEYRLLSVELARLSDLVFGAPEPHLEGCGLRREQVRGELVLRNVGFRYADNEPWLFRNVYLTVRAGECLALAGASGGGKTTLLKLMTGLLSPTEGEILLDGVDLRRIGLRHYRALCASVMQDDRLVTSSLRDNIAFHDPQPSIERVLACAEAACVRAEVEAMPMGFDSLVGDMGAALSGGQQQRLLLARALYAQPRLLFLDEATSALDAATERRVGARVAALGITRVLVAHRLETLQLADRIVDIATLGGPVRTVA